MIVKNEAHIITKTFDNLFSYLHFDYWVISDTGSSDNTKQLIIDYFKMKNIPGELLEHEWSDFGTNRTLALQCAYNKSDYLLIFDADDSIHG
jgi:glycosyltransferase involved in cell wall biosynthesis